MFKELFSVSRRFLFKTRILALLVGGVLLSVGANSFAAQIIVPLGDKPFTPEEKALILRTLQSHTGIQATTFHPRPSQAVAEELEARKIAPFKIMEVPDVVYELWGLHYAFSTYQPGKYKSESDAQNDIYFTTSLNIFRELDPANPNMEKMLSHILERYQQMTEASIPRFPGSSNSIPEHGTHLFRAIVEESRTGFFFDVLRLEEAAMRNDHVLLWRGTDGFLNEHDGRPTCFLDLPLKRNSLFSSNEPYDLTNPALLPVKSFKLMDLSYGQTLMGGSLFDGFCRPKKSACSFVYYKTGSQILYTLSIPRRVFFDNRDLFSYDRRTSPEFAFIGSGDDFHPHFRSVSESKDLFSKGKRFATLLRDYSIVVRNKTEYRDDQIHNSHRDLVVFFDQQLVQLHADTANESNGL
ncbi:MAG: hypothetical protein HYX41_03830 [Bdellovibrio sp.]|nr:hypothetical protein [Bdellovibrio sp.]